MQTQNRALYDWLAQLAGTHWGSGVMFVWAFGEAIVWPIIPDALLFPLAAMRPGAAVKLTIGSALGSALGGITLYLFALNQPATAATMAGALPLVFDWQIAHVTEVLRTNGPAAFWTQPFSGVPFKAWGIIAGMFALDPWQVIPTFVTARSLRMVGTAAVAALLGHVGRRFLRDHAVTAALAYLIVGTGWALTMVHR